MSDTVSWLCLLLSSFFPVLLSVFSKNERDAEASPVFSLDVNSPQEKLNLLGKTRIRLLQRLKAQILTFSPTSNSLKLHFVR